MIIHEPRPFTIEILPKREYKSNIFSVRFTTLSLYKVEVSSIQTMYFMHNKIVHKKYANCIVCWIFN